jgi:hypothetical protein
MAYLDGLTFCAAGFRAQLQKLFNKKLTEHKILFKFFIFILIRLK